MTVVTRFPPSPTGFLHIGSARTALFNWLYARRMGGKFLLRIEDTDRERFTDEAVQAIFDGMDWLELDYDNKGNVPMQFDLRERHAAVAKEMLDKGLAYYCYATPEELEAMRAEQKAKGLPMRYDGRWRDRDPKEAPPGVKPVIRLKAPQTGETTVEDKVRGTVTVQNTQLDDMVLLRGDGTPTYMLSVVVDDHDMGVNHVIRGDDHFTNTFRQVQIIKAMNWPVPVYAHIPLIHGPDGTKLSKRHGALGVNAYEEMGYLPEAMRNYLLRLGWSHGDDEIISTKQALEWFDLEHVQASPARFDFAKLDSVNATYMREADDARLADNAAKRLQSLPGVKIDKDLLKKAMPGLKSRAKTLKELAESAAFYVQARPLALDEKAKKLLAGDGAVLLKEFAAVLDGLPDFAAASIEAAARDFATAKGKKLGDIAQPFRAAVSGRSVSPPIFEAAELLGKPEVLGRIQDVLNNNK
jgi:glutamyl-tRNA synthetase